MITETECNSLKKIFGNFIFENELTILAGSTNVGKSVLAYDLADSLSKGDELFNLENELGPLKILVVDFEMSARSLLKRYPQYSQFSDNLEIIFSDEIYEKSVNFTVQALKKIVEKHKPRLVIVDNVAALFSLNSEPGNVGFVLQFLKNLRALKDEYEINLILISHTTKQMANIPLEITQIQGSQNISNLVDSILMIGQNQHQTRYLKHLKARNGERYTDVLELSLEKPQGENLHFEQQGWVSEYSLLNGKSDAKKIELKEIATNLFDKKFGFYYSEMVRELMNSGLTEFKAKSAIKKMDMNNFIFKKDKRYILNTNEVKNVN